MDSIPEMPLGSRATENLSSVATTAASASSGSSRRSWLISEGALLAASPVLAYGLAYAYEAGYLGRFGLPLWLVSLNLDRVLLVTGAVLVTLIPAYLFLTLLPSTSAWIVLLQRVWPLALLLWLMVESIRAEALVLAVIVFVWLILATKARLIDPIRRHTEVSGKLKRLTVAALRDISGPPDNAVEGALRFVDPSGRVLMVVSVSIVFLTLSLTGAYLIGGRHASSEREFLVRRGDTTIVVVRRYGDFLVAMGVDTTKNLVQRRVVLLPLTATTADEWQLDSLGPLQVEGRPTKPTVREVLERRWQRLRGGSRESRDSLRVPRDTASRSTSPQTEPQQKTS